MRTVQFTHSFLQQLFQAVDMWSVSSLPLHHHAVSAGRKHVKEVEVEIMWVNVQGPGLVMAL